MERDQEQEAAAPDPGPGISSSSSSSGPGSGSRLPGGIGSAEALAALGAIGRRLLWLLPVYLAGRAGLSLGFVVAGVALYMGWRSRRLSKERSLRAAGLLLGDEEATVSATHLGRSLGQQELPAWVSFPDVEKAEWLNKILAQAWPFFGQYMEKLLVENIAPSIRASNTHLQTFTFTKVDMGEKPLKVLGVKVHTGRNKKQILLDLNISYVGDIQVDVEVKKFFCKAGMKGMQLHGMLRVILEPLIGNVPIVGALTMFFIRRPTLDINWTGMTNLLDIPGLSSMSDTMIMDSIASYLVLPNRLLIPLVPDLHEAAELRSPIPRGVVRVYLMEAKDLQSKDKYIKGMIEGKSDPYAVVRVGTQVFTSKVIDENLNPKWNEMYEFIVHEVPGQELEVELFDKDPDQDDFLGRMKLDFGEVMQARVLEEWFPLQDGGRARVRLRMEWHTLMSDASKLDQVLQWNKTISSKPEPPSAAIMVVYLDRAQDLPLKKSSKEPNPMVQLSIHDVTRESKVVYSTVSPVWDDAFRFFLQDPTVEDIDIQVKDDNRQTTLGSLTIRLSRLLNADNLTLDQWFQLENSGPNSRIYMKIVMRVLYLDAPEVCINPRPCPPGNLTNIESVEVGSSVDLPARPTTASPSAEFGSESVIRIHLLEAENLIAKDNFMGGMIKGKSDPYVKVRLGGQKFRSRVIKEELNPRWSEIYEVIVNNIPGQEVEFFQETEEEAPPSSSSSSSSSSSGKESGEFLQSFDEEEVFHVDWAQKENVWRLPALARQMDFKVQGALGNLAVLKKNLEIIRRRTNQTRAQNVPPSATMVYPENPVELGEPNVLVCFVDKFSPPVLNITWLKNGQQVISEGVQETGFLSSEDYTFRKFSYLPFVPEEGDLYACQVDHWGLQESLTRPWYPKLPPPASETPEDVLCGLGLTFGILGVIAGPLLFFKARKMDRGI